MGKIYQALEKSRNEAERTEGHPSSIPQDDAGLEAFQEAVSGEQTDPESSRPDHTLLEGGTAETTDTALNDDNREGLMPEEGIDVQEGGTLDHSVTGQLDRDIVCYYKPHSMEAEQFRLLKTTILFPDEGAPPRTIMVTSTAPDEGKSFVAANLAVSLASSIDEYVLLMDCDLRRPSIHTKFGFSQDTPGLSEYLKHERPLAEILQKTALEKLTIMPCGRPPSNPSELISSDQMRHLIEEVKARYDDRYIIFDSPPPYITAEANALAKQVDAIIIVVRTGKTRKEDLQDLVDTYGKKKILGIVKNFDQPTPFLRNRYHYNYNS